MVATPPPLGGRLNEDHVFGAGSFGVLPRRYSLASGLSQDESGLGLRLQPRYRSAAAVT
jgi:hypothetical protein